VLYCHAIREAMADGMREYRFLLGAEAYKWRFADHDPGLERVVLPTGAAGRAALAFQVTRRAGRGLNELRRQRRRASDGAPPPGAPPAPSGEPRAQPAATSTRRT
jgi:CelD/BcsL family acetyltransferase involved in cellulose biosynthesis